jgi:hypothetical protein
MTVPLNWLALESRFLDELELTGNVARACTAIGISRQSAYERRKRDDGFAAAWDQAIEVATDALAFEARRRALDSSDALIMFLLRAHRPGIYRDQVRHEHQGGLTVRVEYADTYGDAPASTSSSGPNPP